MRKHQAVPMRVHFPDQPTKDFATGGAWYHEKLIRQYKAQIKQLNEQQQQLCARFFNDYSVAEFMPVLSFHADGLDDEDYSAQDSVIAACRRVFPQQLLLELLLQLQHIHQQRQTAVGLLEAEELKLEIIEQDALIAHLNERL